MSSLAVTAASSLSAVPGWVVLVAIATVILLSGVVVILGRYWLENKRPSTNEVQGRAQANQSDGTLVRSWIAISLVSGLLMFCAAALSLGDTTLQSTLFGGLVASVGAAIAFYFSSKSAEQARQDVINATQPITSVPSLCGKTFAQAQAEMATTPLLLVVDDPSAKPIDPVLSQSPAAGSTVLSGSRVSVTTTPIASSTS
jgi:hypothetical protein